MGSVGIPTHAVEFKELNDKLDEILRKLQNLEKSIDELKKKE